MFGSLTLCTDMIRTATMSHVSAMATRLTGPVLQVRRLYQKSVLCWQHKLL